MCVCVFFCWGQAQGVYEQYQNHSPQIEDGNHMESDAVLGEDGEPEMKMQPQIEDGDHDMESDTVVSEDGESE